MEENLAEVEENPDDSENDLGDDKIEEDKLAEVSEESPTEGENEQESEVFSERDKEDAGIDEDADSLVAKENLSEVEENADDTENEEMMRLRRINLRKYLKSLQLKEKMNRNLRH